MAVKALEQIETERLLLRRNVAGDAEVIFCTYAQDAEVTRYLPWMPHKDVTETQGFMQRCRDVWDAGEAFPLAIVRKEDGLLMGMIEVRLEGQTVLGQRICHRGGQGRGPMGGVTTGHTPRVGLL